MRDPDRYLIEDRPNDHDRGSLGLVTGDR